MDRTEYGWQGKPYSSLDAHMTCPNRDGTLGTRGCLFCSGGSGEFAVSTEGKSIGEQLSGLPS